MRAISLFPLCIYLLLTPSVWGQSLTGTILGTVSDQTGAVLPSAEVMIANVGTNQSRMVLTNESGNFSAPNLQVGTYQVEASLPGFSTRVVNDIILRIDDNRRVDFTLEVGQITQVLEVVAETELFQTDTSAVGSVITSDYILQLPLNGRRAETLALLLPGTVNAAQGSEIGTRGGFNISGYDENLNSFFLDGFDNVDPVLRNLSFRPSVDMTEEFSVIQNAYKAEYGRNGGAIINAITKAGTNQFHGSLWEFHRNDNLDARNAFASDGQKPDLLRNHFGVAMGGPIVRNEVFIFATYEGLREKRGDLRRAFVPTLLMREADFSALATPIIDPQTQQAFRGNVIPQDRINPITRAAIEAYPLPNVSGAGPTSPNRLEIANTIDNTDSVSARVDATVFGSQLMGRYSFSETRVSDPFRSTGAGSGTSLKDFGQTNNIIRTNTGLSLTSVLEPNLVHEIRFGYNRFKQPQIPIGALPSEQAPIAGVVKKFLNFAPAGFSAIGSGRQFQRVANVYNFIEQVSLTLGDHQFKIGADVRRYYFSGFSADVNQFAFSGGITGNSLADMYLGLPFQTTSFTGDPSGNTRKTEAATYVQDDWKITPYLTLNLGLRYEWYGRMLEETNRQSNWDPEANSIVIAGQDAMPQLVDDDYNNFAPRFGFALRPFGNDGTVLRGGYGIFYDNEMRHNFFQIGYPFSLTRQFVSGAQNPLTIDNPFPGQGRTNIIPYGLEQDYRDSYGQHWNFGVQREILADTILDVSYVGNHFAKLRRWRNPNQPIEDLGVFPYSPPGSPSAPGPFFLIVLQENAGSSNYHALQVRTEGRPTDRLSLISSYTWGHAIDDRWGEGNASNIGFPFPQNSHDPGLDRASSDFDVRHRYSLSYMYDVPALASEGLAAHILNGWGLTGILTLQSGRPFSVGLINSTVFAMRPNVVDGVDPVPANQGPDNWINPDAFVRPEGLSHGNLGRNTMTGPSYKNFDFSVVRNFQVGEERELEFRSEFFNLTNHPNFGLPGQLLGASDFGVISSTVATERQIQFGLRYEF